MIDLLGRPRLASLFFAFVLYVTRFYFYFNFILSSCYWFATAPKVYVVRTGRDRSRHADGWCLVLRVELILQYCNILLSLSLFQPTSFPPGASLILVPPPYNSSISPKYNKNYKTRKWRRPHSTNTPPDSNSSMSSSLSLPRILAFAFRPFRHRPRPVSSPGVPSPSRSRSSNGP